MEFISSCVNPLAQEAVDCEWIGVSLILMKLLRPGTIFVGRKEYFQFLTVLQRNI